MRTLNEYVEEIIRLRKERGFVTSWENMAEKTMLVITELGRAVDADRGGNRRLVAHELVDGLIRLLDLIGSLDIPPEKKLNHALAVWARTRHQPRHGKRY